MYGSPQVTAEDQIPLLLKLLAYIQAAFNIWPIIVIFCIFQPQVRDASQMFLELDKLLRLLQRTTKCAADFLDQVIYFYFSCFFDWWYKCLYISLLGLKIKPFFFGTRQKWFVLAKERPNLNRQPMVSTWTWYAKEIICCSDILLFFP